MNNDLNIKMKIITSDNIEMKISDEKPIDMKIDNPIKEVDPIFTNSPAYTITYKDIKDWNNKSDFSGNYNDLTNKPVIPTKTSELMNDSGFINKNVSNLTYYTLSNDLSTVATTGDYTDLINLPTIPTDTSDLTNNAGFITNTVDDLTNYTLSSDLATVATSGSYNDLNDTPTLATVATSGLYDDLLNKPTLAVVASTGDYDDLTNKPTIPVVPTDVSAFNNDVGYITNTVNDLTNYTLSSSLATVATTGDYDDLLNKPTIPTMPTMETLNTFSTTETVVGTFEGKPLYRIIYEDTPNVAATTTSTGLDIPISGVKEVFITPYTKIADSSSSGYVYAFPFVTGSVTIGGYISVQTTKLVFNLRKSNNVGVYKIRYVLEYTKTSD